MGTPKYLDARTKDDMLRLNAFSDELSDLAKDFKEWMAENSIPMKMLWYADVFNCESFEHVCSMEMDGDNVILNPPNPNIVPFGRKRPLRYLLHLY